MQTGIFNQVLFNGAADGGNITHMLHHGGKCDGHNHDDGRDQETGIKVLRAEEAENGILHLDRQANPFGGDNTAEIHISGDRSKQVRSNHAHEDGDDLNHTLAPDVADNDHNDCHQRNQPVAGAAVDGGRSQNQANGNDNGARDNGGEEPHHILAAKQLANQCQDKIQQAGTGHTCASIGQCLTLGQANLRTVRNHGEVAGQEGEGGAQENGNFLAGQQVHEQRRNTCKEQRCGNAQPRKNRDQNGRAKHSEQVLHAQNQSFGSTQGTGIIDGIGVLICHFVDLPFFFERGGITAEKALIPPLLFLFYDSILPFPTKIKENCPDLLLKYEHSVDAVLLK